MHSMVWIENDGITVESVNSDDMEERQKVKNLIRKTVSAIFVDNEPIEGAQAVVEENGREENKCDWNPPKNYLKDNNHPCRLPFNSSWGYRRNEAGEFSDINVQRQYRGLRIANQFHDCCSKAVGNAILKSSQVGSVQACYFLLGLKFVKSSRNIVVNLNPLYRK